MHIYLPVAEISTNTLHLIALGLASGFASGLYGIGGGIITTPMLIFYGIPSFVAVGTSTMQLFGTSLSGTIRNIIDKKVDFVIGTVIALGSYVGSINGLAILNLATKHKNEDLLISGTFVTVMLAVILPLGNDVIKTLIKKTKGANDKEAEDTTKQEGSKRNLQGGVLRIYSSASNAHFNILTVWLAGFAVGTCSATIGIGGGIILVPIMSYGFKIPLKIAMATSLYQIVPASLNTMFAQSQKGNVDIVLGIVLLSMSAISVHIGAFVAKKLDQTIIKASLMIILGIMLYMFLLRIFGTPESLFITYHK
jgi:uncharacterized membrane protein YfcA